MVCPPTPWFLCSPLLVAVLDVSEFLSLNWWAARRLNSVVAAGGGDVGLEGAAGLAAVGEMVALITESWSNATRLKEIRKLLFFAWGIGPVKLPRRSGALQRA